MFKLKPIHPGEILKEEFLIPMNIGAYKIAKDIAVPLNRITAIIKETRNISPKTALLLSKYFGLSDNYWTNLQTFYDLELAKDEIGDKLLKIVPFKNFATA